MSNATTRLSPNQRCQKFSKQKPNCKTLQPSNKSVVEIGTNLFPIGRHRSIDRWWSTVTDTFVCPPEAIKFPPMMSYSYWTHSATFLKGSIGGHFGFFSQLIENHWMTNVGSHQQGRNQALSTGWIMLLKAGGSTFELSMRHGQIPSFSLSFFVILSFPFLFTVEPPLADTSARRTPLQCSPHQLKKGRPAPLSYRKGRQCPSYAPL
jgi:hypothetical protein